MKRKHMKLPNGFGSITYLGGNRRNPYGIRKNVGWSSDGKSIRKYIGYASTYNKAYELLLEYNNKPYELDNKNITIDEVYNKLESILYAQLSEKKISKSTYNNIASVYKNHMKEILGKKKIINLLKSDVQRILNKTNLRYTGRNYIKILTKRLLECGTDEYGLNLDLNIAKLNIGKKEKSNKHFLFNEEEISKINKFAENDSTAKMLMIYFYTGLRPSELLGIKNKNVFLKENYMIGGIKTAAGKDRIIPIHSEIKKYVTYFFNEINEYLITNEISKTKLNYDCYLKRFNKLILILDLNPKHTPHNTRHTFATKCEEVGISDSTIKLLMGHSLAGDVTNDVYIHKTTKRLKNEIEKIHFDLL